MKNHIDNFTRMRRSDIIRGEIFEQDGQLCIAITSPEEIGTTLRYPIDFLYVRTLEEILTGAIESHARKLHRNHLQLSILN